MAVSTPVSSSRCCARTASPRRVSSPIRANRRYAIRSSIRWQPTVPAPKVVVDAANRFENEERVLSYFVVGADKLPAAAAPSDTKLKEYYDAHLKDFEAPEYRTVGMLQASPDSQKDAIALTDSELRTEYEARKSDFGTAGDPQAAADQLQGQGGRGCGLQGAVRRQGFPRGRQGGRLYREGRRSRRRHQGRDARQEGG